MREDVELVSPFLVLPKLQRAAPLRRRSGDAGTDYTVLWFKADQAGMVLGPAGQVLSWPEALGRAPAVPAVVDVAPTWQPKQQNALPAVLFNASALVIEPSDSTPNLPTDPWTAGWVARIISGTTFTVWTRFAVSANGALVRGPLANASTVQLTGSMYGSGDDGVGRIVSGFVTSLPLTTWHAVVMTYDGSARPGAQSFAIWLDGVALTVGAGDLNLPIQVAKTPLVARSVIGGALQTGSPVAYTQGPTFQLGELLVAKRQFQSSEAVQFSQYLKARWGTP